MADRTYRVRRNDAQTDELSDITGIVINSGSLILHRDNVPVMVYRPDWWLQVTLLEPTPEPEPEPEPGE